MNTPFLDLKQTEEGWQAVFAFQIFHRQSEEWLRMRWGFNASVLLEEALDRVKLFVESQTISDAEYRSVVQPQRTVALRGINLPERGVQMGVLGKTSAEGKDDAQQAAVQYARELYSTFPHDFILVPAETSETYEQLAGQDLLNTQTDVAQIQRAILSIPSMSDHHFLPGLWQASVRSNEQIWRALSNMPCRTVFNITLQPTFFYEGERHALQELRSQLAKSEPGSSTSTYAVWLETILKRRLALWKRFFILQIHVMAEGRLDENLLRSIGSSLTRDTNDQALPGFQVKWPDTGEMAQEWCEAILSLGLISSSRMEDLADSDEAFAVFRIPYISEAGLPGANFITQPHESPPK